MLDIKKIAKDIENTRPDWQKRVREISRIYKDLAQRGETGEEEVL